MGTPTPGLFDNDTEIKPTPGLFDDDDSPRFREQKKPGKTEFSVSPAVFGSKIIPKETQEEIMKSLYDVPSAAIRSGLMGQGYARGAKDFENVPTFKSLIDADLRRRSGFDRMGEDAQTVLESAMPQALKSVYDTVTSIPDFLTNPGEILTAMAIGKSAPKIATVEAERGTSLLNSARMARDRMITPKARIPNIEAAEKLTTEILNPPTGSIQSSYERGFKYKPTEVAARYIKKSKNYRELQKNIESVIKGKMDERNYLIRRYNRPIGRTYIDSLRKYIVEQRRLKQTPDNELRTMQEVLDKEITWAKRQRKLNTIKAQERKEYLEDMTEKLLEKRAEGEKVSRDPARSRALDKLRDALKEKIEISHPQIKKNNELYGALLKAKSFIARQRALADKALTPSKIEQILEKIPGLKAFIKPRAIPEEIAKTALKKQRSLESITSKIEKFRKGV